MDKIWDEMDKIYLLDTYKSSGPYPGFSATSHLHFYRQQSDGAPGQVEIHYFRIFRKTKKILGKKNHSKKVENPEFSIEFHQI